MKVFAQQMFQIMVKHTEKMPKKLVEQALNAFFKEIVAIITPLIKEKAEKFTGWASEWAEQAAQSGADYLAQQWGMVPKKSEPTYSGTPPINALVNKIASFPQESFAITNQYQRTGTMGIQYPDLSQASLSYATTLVSTAA